MRTENSQGESFGDQGTLGHPGVKGASPHFTLKLPSYKTRGRETQRELGSNKDRKRDSEGHHHRGTERQREAEKNRGQAGRGTERETGKIPEDFLFTDRDRDSTDGGRTELQDRTRGSPLWGSCRWRPRPWERREEAGDMGPEEG